MSATGPVAEPTGKLHDAWVKIGEAIHDRIGAKAAKMRTDATAEMLERFERDVKPLIGPVVQPLLDDPNTPDEVRALIARIAEPEHFSESIIIGFALGAVLSPVLGAALGPVIQGVANSSWTTITSAPGYVATVPPSPTELAMGNIKGVDALGGNAVRAQESGTRPEDLDFLTKIAGNAIGIAEALVLWRRGDIGQDEFDKVLKYSNVNPDFYGDARLLYYDTPSVGAAITAALKGHLAPDVAQNYAARAGLNPDVWEWHLQSAGRPPGLQQMLQLWNHGLASETDVENAVRQSDINDAYLPFVKDLRIYFPPPRSVVPMLRSGAINEARARELLEAHGVTGQDVDAFIAEATINHTGAVKEATSAQLAREYEEGLISAAELSTHLTALKYTADAITQITALADKNRTATFRNAAVTHTRSLYVKGKLTDAQAQAQLTQIGLPPAAVTEAMKFFTIEKGAIVERTSVAADQGAYYRGILTLPQFISRVAGHGFTGLDAKILAANAFPHGKTPPEVLALPG